MIQDALCTMDDHGIDSIDCILNVLKHDWSQLLDGVFNIRNPYGMKWPKGSERRRRAGQDIMGGYFAGIVQLRADMDWHFKVHRSFSFEPSETERLTRYADVHSISSTQRG